jgi:tRNA G18 (ribose-2'-O)-methylase SpoU
MSRRSQNRGIDRGYFGVAVYHPKIEVNIGSLWRSASAFGASYLATIGRRYQTRQAGDTTDATAHIPLLHFQTMDDLLDHLPRGCPLVGVELDPRATELSSYHHRDRALYLFGAEDRGLPSFVLDQCHDLVQIPTKTPWSINLACAGSVVLGHRYFARMPQSVPAHLADVRGHS